MKLFWICPQIKISKHIFQDVPAHETVQDMPTNETDLKLNVSIYDIMH
jgi:hypothetical protein